MEVGSCLSELGSLSMGQTSEDNDPSPTIYQYSTNSSASESRAARLFSLPWILGEATLVHMASFEFVVTMVV